LVSLFTAIFVTRTFLHFIIGWRFLQVPWLFGAQSRRTETTSVAVPSGSTNLARSE
jgi:hypothetical protein